MLEYYIFSASKKWMSINTRHLINMPSMLASVTVSI